MERGKLTLITGPMRASKSLELIQWMERQLEIGRRVCALAPAGSSRWGVEGISSRGGQTPSPRVRQHAWEDAPDIEAGAAIAVDEGQFCQRLAARVGAWLAAGHDVAVAALDFQWTGARWPTTDSLLLVGPSHYVHLRARCGCGGRATRTAARPEHTGGIEVVGDELYVPLCEACWARRGELGYRTS